MGRMAGGEIKVGIWVDSFCVAFVGVADEGGRRAHTDGKCCTFLNAKLKSIDDAPVYPTLVLVMASSGFIVSPGDSHIHR
jgi:hypothetical protein